LIGGCGYVGSALRFYLAERSFEVDALDLEWFGNPGIAENSVRDYADLTKEDLREYDAVILLAGHSSVLMCEKNREAAFKNNVQNFVELLGKLEGQKFLYASSASVYGNTRGKDAREDEDRFEPAGYYDVCKCEIDYYTRLSGLDYYGLRFGTVNGFAPHTRTDVMLNKMVASSKRSGALEVANLEVNRPILGVRDLCRAVGKILESRDRKPGLYNLASFNITVGEIAERAASVLEVPVVRKPSSNAYDMRISTTKFEDAFDFKFQETVETIVELLQENWDRALKTTRSEPRAYVRSG
jgi:nucleoside-diphosphate-sugar epimerase